MTYNFVQTNELLLDSKTSSGAFRLNCGRWLVGCLNKSGVEALPASHEGGHVRHKNITVGMDLWKYSG